MASQTKKITADTAAIFFGKVVGLFFGMWRLNYLSTYLGLANFGMLNFALYFCSLFQVLFDFGMSQLLTREISRDLTKSAELVGRIIILKILVVLAAGAIVGLIGIVLNFDNQTNWAILLTTAVFAINGLSMIFLGAFQAHRKMKLVSFSNIFNDLVLSLFVILIIKSSPLVMTVLVLSVGVAAANLAILYVIYRKSVGAVRFRVDGKLWKDFMRESLPIAMNSMGVSAYMYVGPSILKYARGNVEVAIFTAGYKLVSVIMLIPMAYAQVIYPVFSEFYSAAKEKLSKALNDSLRIMSIISFPVAAGAILLAPEYFGLVYPAEFNPGIWVFQLSVISIIPAFMNWVTATFLMAVNRQTVLMSASLLLGAAATLISLLLVPAHGYRILPVMMIAIEFLVFASHRIYLQKISHGDLKTSAILKPFAASLLMGGILMLLPGVNFVVLAFIGAAAYLLILWMIGGLGEQERQIIIRILNRARIVR